MHAFRSSDSAGISSTSVCWVLSGPENGKTSSGISGKALVPGPLKLTVPEAACDPSWTHCHWNVQLPLPVKVMEPVKWNVGGGFTAQSPVSRVVSAELQSSVTMGHIAVNVKADAGTGVGVGGGGGAAGGAVVGGSVLLRAGCGLGVAEAVGLTCTSRTVKGWSSSSAWLPATSVALMEIRWSPRTGTDSVRLKLTSSE